jgi:hypothetical protein
MKLPHLLHRLKVCSCHLNTANYINVVNYSILFHQVLIFSYTVPCWLYDVIHKHLITYFNGYRSTGLPIGPLFFLNIHELQQYLGSQIYMQIHGTKYHFLHLIILNLLQQNFCSKDVVTSFYSMNSFNTYFNHMIIPWLLYTKLHSSSTTAYKPKAHEMICTTWYRQILLTHL